MTHEGRANYATWGVALIIDNDQALQSVVHTKLAALRRDAAGGRQVLEGIWTEQQWVIYTFSEWLPDYVRSLCQLDDAEYTDLPQMTQQLLAAALDEVDWDELARDYYNETAAL